jgi:hypothetical protein
MSQVQGAAPPLAVPSNAREGVVSRREARCLSLRLSLSTVTLSVFYTLYWIIVSIMFLYGYEELFYINIVEYAIIFISVIFFYLFATLLVAYYYSRKMHSAEIRVIYGFTPDYFYGANEQHQTVRKWEYYSRWKEVKKHFLMFGQGIAYIVPKAMWSEAEVSELRSLMRAKIGKR